jgi:antitoxin component YwqK of YwqJK toxin-antitoxin module
MNLERKIKDEIKILNKKILLQEFNLRLIAQSYEYAYKYGSISFSKVIEKNKSHNLKTLYCHSNTQFGVQETIMENGKIEMETFTSVNNLDGIFLH